ncbi:MAG: hypothetical protein NTZ40_07150 [Cyanobacteria bacterium]|nr:hypothetical protein [Cyanobacteriota bacterium]
MKALEGDGLQGLSRGIALAVAVLVSVLYLRPPTDGLRRGVVHVAPDGFDGWLGQSRRHALRTIQRAADLAGPGETILVWPGVYAEDIHLRRGGRPGQPLVMRAAVPGQAVITGAAGAEVPGAWRWRSLGGGLYATAVAWRVDGLRVDGVMAYRSPSTDHLRQICARAGAWPAFSSSRSRLVLCLPRGGPPRAERLQVRRPMPLRRRSGGHQMASLWIEAPWVEVRDLRFDFAVMAAIQLWHTHHVRVEGNSFEGADVAVNDSPSVALPGQVVVERNFSSCYPLAEWSRRGWLSWRELYFYSNCSLTWLQGADLEVVGNLINQVGDGIKISPVGGQNIVRGNLITETTDDAFEFDGPARQLKVLGNGVLDPLVVLGVSPVTDGPLVVENNVFVAFPHPPEVGYGVLLKLMGGDSRDVSVVDNTYLGEQIGWQDDSRLIRARIRGNRLATVRGVAGMDQGSLVDGQANRLLTVTRPQWAAASRDPGSLPALASMGVRPLRLGPVGPAWWHAEVEAAGRSVPALLRSPWIKGP